MINNLLRYIVIFSSVLGIILSGFIAYPYIKQWREHTSPHGLLGYHVVTISISWSLLAANALWRSFERIDHPLAGDIILRLFGSVLGVTAMIILMKHLKTKQRQITDRLKGSTALLEAQVESLRRKDTV